MTIARFRMRSANSAGSSKRALRTSRAKRARRRSDTPARYRSLRAGRPHALQRPCSQPTHAGLRKTDLLPDLAEREATAVREDEHAALERGEVAKRRRHRVPPLVARPRGAPRLGQVADPFERDLDIRRGHVLAQLLRRSERAPRGAGEGI